MSQELPHNVEAEKGLLAACMLDGGQGTMSACLTKNVDYDAFYRLQHQVLWSVLAHLFGDHSALEETLVIDHLQNHTAESIPWLKSLRKSAKKVLDQPLIDIMGGISGFMEISDSIETTAQARFWLEIVLEKWNRRRMIQASRDAIARAYDENVPYIEILGQTETAFMQLSAGEGSTLRKASAFMPAALERMEQARLSDKKVIGIPTGLIDVDNITRGLQPEKFYLFAARPGAGKSALAAKFVGSAGKNSRPVLVFSIEMGAEEYGQRMICSWSRVNYDRYVDGLINHGDMQRVMNATDALSQYPIWIDDASDITIHQIRAIARRMKSQHDLAMVVIDYIQIVQGDRNVMREQQVAQISGGCKRMSRELKLPVVGLCQVNRDVEKRGDAFLRLSDLRESGSLEQDADVVGFINPTEKDPDTQKYVAGGKMILDFAKHRGGPVTNVPLTFQKEITNFENYSNQQQPAYNP